MSGCGHGFSGWGRKNKRQFLFNIEARLANELCDRGSVEPGGIVFHTQGVGGTIETKAADAVNILCGGKCEGHGIRGRNRVAIENLHRGHRAMITSRGALNRMCAPWSEAKGS